MKKKMNLKKIHISPAAGMKIILFLFLWIQMTPVSVYAAPQIVSVNPASLGQGVSGKLLAVYGTGFQCGMTVSFSSNPTVNLTVTTANDAPANQFVDQCLNYSTTPATYTTVKSNVKYFSDSNVFIYVTVSASPLITAPAAVTMTFTNPDGSTGTSNLMINPAPTITNAAANPATITAGVSFDLTLTGTGFQNGATLSFSQAGISGSALSVDSSGLQATDRVAISETAAPESATVTLTNPDGGSVIQNAAFMILPLLGEKTPLLTVYEDPRFINGGYRSFHRFWNGEWSDEGVLSSTLTGGNRLELVVKSHPFRYQQMMGHMVYSNTEFQVWDKGGWGHSFVVSKNASVFGRGTFDLAYESSSGNGLAVYGTLTTINSNGGIYYRRFFQDTALSSNCDLALAGNSAPPCWGPETPMPNPGFASGKFLWKVKLIANPDKTKDEILIVYEDNTQCNAGLTLCSTLFVRQWNGSLGTFSSGSAVSTPGLISIASTVSWAFDAVYTGVSNTGVSYQPIIAWIEANNGTPKTCFWNGTSCPPLPSSGFPVQTGSTATTQLFQIQLRADPFSDQVAMGTRQGQGTNGILKVQIGQWGGTNWTTPSSYPTDPQGLYTLSSTLAAVSGRSGLSFNLLWQKSPEDTLSSLFGIYTNSAGGLNYQIWSPDLAPSPGWNGDASVPGLPTENPLTSFVAPYLLDSIQFDSDPRTGDIFGGMKTTDSIFSTIRWDGDSSSWVDYQQVSSGDYLSLFKDPFGISYFKSFPTLFATTTQLLFTQGNVNISVSIRGRLIQDGASLSFPGFVQTSSEKLAVTVTHDLTDLPDWPDQIDATGSISNTVVPGSYPLTVTNPDGSLVVKKGFIKIVPSSGNPVIYSVDPSSRGQGAIDQTIHLYGYNLTSSSSVSFTFPNGTVDPNIVVTSAPPLNPVSSGQIQNVSVQVDIGQTAPAGPRNLVINSGGQSYPFSGLFTVNYGPTITGVKPASIIQGTTQSGILVSGNDFQAGADIILSDGAFSLGWPQPGTIPSSLYQNKMTGNRFLVYSGTSTSVVLDSIIVKAALVGPSGKLHGQVAVYDDNNGVPGNLILKTVSKIQTLSSAGTNGLNTFRYNLTTPVILPANAKYWVLLNVEGGQTVIPYTDYVINTPCNGDTSCDLVSTEESFGSWPKTGGGASWSRIANRKLAVALGYYPVIGTEQIDLSPTLGTGQYQGQMTGSRFTLDAATKVPFLYLYAGSVDSTNPSAQMAIYSDSGGVPLNLLTVGRNIVNSRLVPNSFNFFQIPRIAGVDFSLTGGLSYWAVSNVSGSSTTLAYTLAYNDLVTGVPSVQSGWPYGTWPDPFGASSPDANRRYSLFAVKALAGAGNTTATVTDGPDSNQITGTKFTAATATNLVGISLYVDWVDPNNPLGSVAVYDDNNGVPGTLQISTTPQILQPHSFNTFTVPITQRPIGSYWIVANLAGAGTTLTYDEGTSNDSVKKSNLFSNGWSTTGGLASSWTHYPGRRYAIRVVPDVMVTASNGLSGSLITGTVTVDPNANPTTGTNLPREICVINPDGGKICEAFDPSTLPLFQVVQGINSTPAMVAYGTTSSSYPISRKWNGYAPWSLESASPVSAGGGALWSVLRALTTSGMPSSRAQEKILGTVSSAPLLALQVWNGTSWGNSFNLAPSSTGSRSFDLAYETLTGRGIVVYGVSGNAVPQYRIWNGSWSAVQGVGSANTTGNTVLWVRLEPNPKTNEMILAYLSGSVSGGALTNATLHTLVWNGTALSQGTVFGHENSFSVFDPLDDNINLCQTCTPPIVGQSFDIAYEHSSGRAVLAWGVWGNSTPLYAIWDGSSGASGAWLSSSLSAKPVSVSPGIPLVYFKMAGDPFTNQIALGTATLDGQSFDIQIWDGSASWGTAQNMLYDSVNNLSYTLLYKLTAGVSPSSDPNFNPGRNFDLAWEKDSGKLVTVFGSSHSVNACKYSGGSLFPYSTRYRVWDSSSQLWASDLLLPNIGQDIIPRWVQLVQDTSSNDLFLELSGHPVTTYSNNNNLPDTATCVAGENTTTHLSDLKIMSQFHYWRHQGAWIYKEGLTTLSSSAIRAIRSGLNYTAYGESLMTAFDPDNTAPSAVSDLTYTAVTNNSVVLQWTAAGDDGSLGRAASYTVAYSLTPVYNDTDFANIPSGQKKTISATPFPVNTALTYTEVYTVPGLNPSTPYCFAVIATDRAGNSSSLSSSVNPCATTASAGTSGAGITSPGAIKDLAIIAGTMFNNSVQLTWTAPGSAGYLGTAAAYDLRYSSAPIVNEASFNTATPAIAKDGSGRNGLAAPHPAGTREIFTFTELPSVTTYFAIKACGALALNSQTLRCDSTLSPLNVSFLDYNNGRNINLSTCPDNSNHSNNSPVCVINSGSSTGPAPSSIADLVVSSVSSNSMTLRWTSPSNTIQGAWYDLRVSTGTINPSNFDSLSQVKGVPVPLPAGFIQSFLVKNLPSNTTGIPYQFVLKTVNPNLQDSTNPYVSLLSNIAQGTTLKVYDISPPARIQDLTVIQKGINQKSILLSWTATGDDGSQGSAMQYDIRYATSPIADDAAFQNASRALNTPYPLPSGNTEFFPVTGLNSNTVYYFSVKAIDKGSNDSGLSSCVTLLPDDTKVPSDCSGHSALHSGYNLVSVPYRLSGAMDTASVFGNDVSRPVTIYQWQNGDYSIPSIVAEGSGYFLYATGNNSVLKASDASGNLLGVPETSTTVTIPLQTGWNMIGNPYLYPIYLKDACIKSGSGPSLPFASAAASMIIGPGIYSYDGTQYNYEPYHDTAPPPDNKPDAQINPWNGYWLQLLAGGSNYSFVYPNTPGACP